MWCCPAGTKLTLGSTGGSWTNGKAHTYKLGAAKKVKDTACANVPPQVPGRGIQYPMPWATDPAPETKGKVTDPKGPLPASPSTCGLRESVPWCGKCQHDDQCAGPGTFCSPFMKQCVPSQTHDCSPRPNPGCSDCPSGRDPAKCVCANAAAVGFPAKWAKPLCPAGTKAVGTKCDAACKAHQAKKAKAAAAYKARAAAAAKQTAALRKAAEAAAKKK